LALRVRLDIVLRTRIVCVVRSLLVARHSRYSSSKNSRWRCVFRSAGKSAPFLLSQSCNFESRDGTNSNGDDVRNDSRNNDEENGETKNKKLFKYIFKKS